MRGWRRRSEGDGIARRLDAIAEALERHEAALRALLQDDPANRQRLREARAAPTYAEAFDAPEPLVSVIIPTWERTDLLLERSLPSVLEQTYERLEVIVVGDAVGPEVGAAVQALRDPRLRYANLPSRMPDPSARTQWFVGSVPGRNAGYAMARGAWLVDFDEDDFLRPRAIEHGLTFARERRVEVAFGQFEQRTPDGAVEILGTFPPRLHEFAFNGALVHAAIGFFLRTSAAAIFDAPNDWFRAEAMIRAGVRFGMHDEIAFDYFPSMRGAS